MKENEIDRDQVAFARLQRLRGIGLLREILELFLQYTPIRIDNAQSANRRGDYEGVEQAVHSLRSSAGNIGAQSIQNLAEMIERAAEQSQSEEIGPLLLDLQVAWERVEPLLRQTIEGLDHETNRCGGG